MFLKIALLAAAGAIGTLSRYGLAGLVQRLAGPYFPWGTLAVNVLGCFLAGMLWALFRHRLPVTPESRAVVMIGFMGAFTTFSAFILETGELMRAHEWIYAFANFSLQNGLGLAALLVGMAAGRLI